MTDLFSEQAGAIRILIVDDSLVVRGIWKRILSSEKDFAIVGLAENGKRALELVAEIKPDLILLDIEMPEMDGLTALPLLFKAHVGVRVIMASSLTQQGSSATIHALALGASDYIAKPSSSSLGASAITITQSLVQKIRSLKYPTREKRLGKVALPVSKPFTSPTSFSPPKVLVIGCSTGGPNALVSVLKSLNFASFKIPIVIVQHMPAYFIQLLADRVAREIGRDCDVVTGNQALIPGFIGIAPGDRHVEITGAAHAAQLVLNQNPPENYCRPAVDPLFRSASQVYGSHVLGVVLTGMGEDGRRGCEVIRKNGGLVIAQDEETSTVWGMPGAVAKANLAQYILPLSEIAGVIQKLCRKDFAT